MASKAELKRPRLEDSDSYADRPSPKRPRSAFDSQRDTQVKRWMRSQAPWLEFVQQLTRLEEGDNNAEQEKSLVEILLLQTTEEGEELLPELQHIGLEIMRAVQQDLAVFAIELGKLYVSVRAQEQITIKSWSAEYEGDGVKIFQTHIRKCSRMMTQRSDHYAANFVVANSSGMGKTRMIDESSKTQFTVLLVLRNARGGFPPPDSDVLEYFLSSTRKNNCQTAIICFLATLYDQLAKLLQGRQEEVGPQNHAEIARWFRAYIVTWSDMYKPSPQRIAFFQRVVKNAETMVQRALGMNGSRREEGRDRNQPPSLSDKDEWCKSLMINSFKMLSRLLRHDETSRLPSVLLAFDEAHTLLIPSHNAQARAPASSIYTVLCRVLRYLKGEPHMACFVSTSGSVVEFAAPIRLDASSRIHEGLSLNLPPFTTFPFNMAQIQPEEMDLQVVGKESFMCRQSRILFRGRAEHGVDPGLGDLSAFAEQKLLGSTDQFHHDYDQRLAILARRIPIDIRTNTDAGALQSINRQIAQHMRVLYGITGENKTLITGSPSEPILAEGAKNAMNFERFQEAYALRDILTSPGINDMAKFSIPAFFECLLTDASWLKLKTSQASRGGRFHTKTFEETFQNSFGNFNHIVKLHGDVPGSEFWYRFLTRRVAASTKFNRMGIDAAFPHTIDGTKIAPDNTTSTVVQTKAVADMQSPSKKVFDRMDSVVREMHESDEINSTSKPKPVNRVVFSLKSHEKDVTVMRYEDQHNDLLTWDIYVPFAALRAVEKDPLKWTDVLDTELRVERMYGGDVALMGMDPASDNKDAYWPNWAPTARGTSDDAGNAGDDIDVC
ncbi:hypothetical protein DACRYDRAFT_107146 [Dacryopinax primogenitus]|uniref:Uncharacterized protein n=1 Tax=Dacryopinax primogenitus (strain DJM 731) TaxID=1858805 RepID=M5GDB0_DACPD|nr:uncharacterized protein DACRYDRAFT_107146 [Dacryopinax primogenitus]EJU02213.1 hypothetical protein DACRYDRAFT_107146 [Dacryopinax primogenitus]